MHTAPPAGTTKSASRSQRILLFILITFFKVLIAFILLTIAVVGGVGLGAYMRVQSLPDVAKLQYYDPNERSELLTADGVVLKQLFGEENRKVVTYKNIAPDLTKAVMAIEDARFEKHTGVDPIGIIRAFKANMESQVTVQGGSTITQQLVKNLFLTPERSYARKAAEAVLSVQVDQMYSKDQILELYLNQIYFGHNAYGAEAASETYFAKPAKDLKLHEAAMIAGMIRGPEIYSPYRNYKATKIRQAAVLNKMVEYRFIDRPTAEKAKAEPLLVSGLNRGMLYPYFTTYAMHYLKEKYTDTELETKGLKIYTTLDIKKQDAAKRILWSHLERLKRANVEQGALVNVDAKTGHVLSMVGGTDFGASEFNRAYQAQRQTGSSFKPFVYVTGFENGYYPESTEVDGPVTYPDGDKGWSPQNYGRNYKGTVTLRSALMGSINVVAVKVMDKVGISKVLEMTKRLGIKSEVRPFLSSALGASEITPLEMAQAYSVFANDGVFNDVSPILKIEDKYGNIILDNTHPAGKRVLAEDVVRDLNSSLVSVVSAGTGAAARIPGHEIAGKTGTTSSHKDAWFMGYTPHYVTALWVGNDKPERMFGATGGGFCAPIWREYMAEILKDEKPEKFPPRIKKRRERKFDVKGTAVRESRAETKTDKTQQVRERSVNTPASTPNINVRQGAPRVSTPVGEARQPSGRLSGPRSRDTGRGVGGRRSDD
jgi:penicillin-binding protein 1A